MTNLLVYWRDCLRNRADDAVVGDARVWHSSARVMQSLTPGDRLWLVGSGQALGVEPGRHGWLVEVWRVDAVVPNPGDDPRYPRARYAQRIEARVETALSPPTPRNIDPFIRPPSSSATEQIGSLLQGPRRMSEAAATALEALLRGDRGAGPADILPTAPPQTAAHHAPPITAPLDHDRIALGIRQPWAELILRGLKSIEVRTLETNVRGPIYLYTSQAPADIPAARQAAAAHQLDVDSLPRGLIVGTVEIIDCRPGTRQDAAAACVPATVLQGRKAWVLARPQRLAVPVRPRFLPYGVWFYPFRRRHEQ